VSAPLSDTPREVEEVQIALLRDLPPWHNLHLVAGMYEAARRLSLAGLRREYPDASEAELQRRLMDLFLGPELAGAAYGPPPAERTP
jgi:hypothetical protein